MARLLCIALFLLAITNPLPAQKADDTIARRDPQLSFSLGMTYTLYTRLASFIDFNTGLQGRVYCRFADKWRLSAEYTQLYAATYESWEDVKQKYYDINLHYISLRVNRNSLFYSLTGSDPPPLNLLERNRYHKPVFLYAFGGLHIDDFNATYKGDPKLQAHQIAFQYTYPGTRMNFLWFGANLGIGKEKIFRRFSLYSEFKLELNERLPNFTFSLGMRR